MKLIKIMLVFLAVLLVGCIPNKGQTGTVSYDEGGKSPSVIVNVKDGDNVKLSADIITKEIDGVKYEMYGYNGMIPGVAFRADKGAKIKVYFTNNIDQETTVHWHGLRHDIKDDGVPGITQKPVKPGQSFTYDVYFPDSGIFWYHPHIREDSQQDKGLAGTLLVNSDNYNKANREELIVLDDILIKDNEIVPYGEKFANHALMGRFGNVMLINGETSYDLEVKQGEIVRFFIANVANARPFKISFENAKMKLVGSDIGLYEKETFVDNVVIAPAERYIVEVYFENPGAYSLLHETPKRTYNLGKISVSSSDTDEDYSGNFKSLYINKEVIADIGSFSKYFNRPVDYELSLTLDMGNMHNMDGMGMMNPNEENIEWEDGMGMMNSMSTSENIKWIIKDRKTGKENMDFSMNAKVGDKIKIRLFNDPDSMHPMQHPIHLHGQRFLILEENGVRNNNLVWKDTVLVPKGSAIDILVDVTNPGQWMFHCHIAEHLEAGMMTSLKVEV